MTVMMLVCLWVLRALTSITSQVVQQQDWAMSTYGPLRCLARDWHGEKLWLCSERHAFEVKIHQEERASMRILPLALTDGDPQIQIVARGGSTYLWGGDVFFIYPMDPQTVR